MKKRWLVIFALLMTIIACNFPFTEPDLWEITSINVSPPSGEGQFTARVKGNAFPGERTLVCYIPGDNGNQTVFTKTWQVPQNDVQNFNQEFSFSYAAPGEHYLVCGIKGFKGSEWSDSFIVTSQLAPGTAPIPGEDILPSMTPTKIPVLTLNGTFQVAGNHIVCPDGSTEPNPAADISGTLQLSVDFELGKAFVIIEGTAGDVTMMTCNDASPYTLRYTIDRSTVMGTVDPGSSALTLSEYVSYSIWNSCYNSVDNVCTEGELSGLLIPLTLSGTVDQSKQTASGKIYLGSAGWEGDWQASIEN